MIQQLSGLPNLTVTLITACPYVLALMAMVLFGWSSDRTGERRWHTAIPLLGGGVALALSVAAESYVVAGIILLTLATVGVWTYLPSFWALPTAILSEAAAAASIGFINSVGNLGGFAGPYAVGYLQTATGSTHAGMMILVVSLALAAILVLQLHPAGDK
jgi:nitrate/nitrite transporter NarK